MSDPKPAFAAAPPSADLQEEVEGLLREARHWVAQTGVTRSEIRERIARIDAILARRLSNPTREPDLRVHADGEECDVGNCSRGHYSIPNPEYRATPPPPAGSRPEDAELLQEAKHCLARLIAKYGYEDDNVTPKDWTEYVEAREVVARIEALSRGKPVEYHGPALDIKGGR